MMKLIKCFFCNKLKFTPYHITEITPSGIESYDMCKECGWTFVQDAYEPKQHKPQKIDVTQIQSPEELLNFIMSIGASMTPTPKKPNCQCGMSAAEFELHGKFGCAHCYEHFSEYIQQLVVPYHGADEHVGKRPKHPAVETSPDEQLKTLKLRLAKAIEIENYEEAGKIHAQIKSLSDSLPHSTSLDQ